MPQSAFEHPFRVAVLTATRAEYGLLTPVIRALQRIEGVEPYLLVTGMHLCEEFGMTVHQIEKDGFAIDARIPILGKGDDAKETSHAMARALMGFGDYFSSHRPDCLVVLGDRFEALAVSCAAFNARIPIVHLHGGERTDGAADDAYRHCITKMSHLHFTATEEYRRRVIQLGEDPARVFCVGALGVENIKSVPLMPLKEVSESIGYDLQKPFVLMTYHPTTMSEQGADAECREVLAAMDRHSELTYLVTAANADAGGRIINRIMEEYAREKENVCFVKSLGLVRYLSAMKEAAFVMGNSSSALLETPSFGIPSVNIGIRQKGRVAGDSVIHCDADAESICRAMETAMSDAFRTKASTSANPYERENTSSRIAEEICRALMGKRAEIKSFYDIKQCN